MAKNDKRFNSKVTKKPQRRPTLSWSAANVSKRTREKVARAAKEEGVSVEKWVEKVLRDSAEATLKGRYSPLALPPDLLHALSDVALRVKQLSERGPFGDRALQHVQASASEVGDHVSSAYDVLVRRADSAIDEIRSWTDKRLIESGKWGAGVIEQMKSAADGIVKLQALVGRPEKRDHGSST